MLDWLGCLVMGLFVDRCSLQDAQLLFDALQKAAATVAIVGTAAWAYMRYVKGRTFKRRLHPEISGEARRFGGKARIVVAAKATNVGLSKVEFDRADTGLRVFTHAAEAFSAAEVPSPAAAPAGPSPPPTDDAPPATPTASVGEAEVREGEEAPSEYLAKWEFLATLPVFAETARLEPGEPVLDEPLVEIPGGFYAVRLELWVASPPRRLRRWLARLPFVARGARKRWRATAIVLVAEEGSRVDNTGGTAGRDARGAPEPDQKGD